MTIRQSEKRKHLGRGLESLLGPIHSDASNQTDDSPMTQVSVKSTQNDNIQAFDRLIPINLISPNPFQSRTHWDDDKLEELSSSIKIHGLIQPIIVRKVELGYQIIAGERRFRASQMAGLTEIPAILRNIEDDQMHEWALIENIHRSDLNPIDRAKAYHRYIEKFSLTQKEAAERLGEDRSVISNYLRLLELPSELREMLIESQLSMGHARAILSLPNDDLRRKLANRTLTGRLSVREVERQVKLMISKETKNDYINRTKSPHILDLEENIKSQIGSKVKINTSKNGQSGKMIIEFNSLDEFDRILDRIGVKYNNEI